MTNQETAQAFADGHVEGANTAHSMYIRDNRIYSYGEHFIIAQRNGANDAVVTNRKYSTTTSKHTGMVLRALEAEGYDVTRKTL